MKIGHTRRKKKPSPGAVAVFQHPKVQGHVVATPCRGGVDLVATFHRLPPGLHGFHIHKGGDMRRNDCMGLCEHYHKGRPQRHGAGPGSTGRRFTEDRHTGDLGNLRGGRHRTIKRYCLPGVSVRDLWGRSVIVHEDEDDLGRGSHEDSGTTGHSGARMAAAVWGRMEC